MPVGPILVLFMQGFIAMEVAYHLGPRNFRSNSETYKYVIALLLGTVVFAMTTVLSHRSWGVYYPYLQDPTNITLGWVAATVGNAILVGLFWHFWFSWVVPIIYRFSRWARIAIFRRPVRQYHGPIRVFDRAMDMMDGLRVQVFLKDSRVLFGSIKSYPSLDGDSGIVLEVYRLGVLLAPRKPLESKAPNEGSSVVIQVVIEPKKDEPDRTHPDDKREQRGSWDVKWIKNVPFEHQTLMWIPQSNIDYINSTDAPKPSVRLGSRVKTKILVVSQTVVNVYRRGKSAASYSKQVMVYAWSQKSRTFHLRSHAKYCSSWVKGKWDAL